MKLKQHESKIRLQATEHPELDKVRVYIDSKGVTPSKLDIRNSSFPTILLQQDARAKPKPAAAKQ